MNRCEAKIVKRRLASYKDLLARADLKDREISDLQDKYVSLATPGAIQFDRSDGSRSNTTKETLYLEIFSDQTDAYNGAVRCRAEAGQIVRFIDLVDDPEAKQIMHRAYVGGESYYRIGTDLGYTQTGVRMKIDRALERVPSKIAEACGML